MSAKHYMTPERWKHLRVGAKKAVLAVYQVQGGVTHLDCLDAITILLFTATRKMSRYQTSEKCGLL